MKKVILISFVIFVILVPLSVFLAFDGAFDKKYSREELTQNFVEHEKAFSDVEDFFWRRLPKGADFSVLFGLGRGGRVNFYLYPNVVDPANKVVGGNNLEVGSQELDSVLLKLGWTNEIVRALREKLGKTNCDWIRTLDGRDDRVEIYPSQSGWGSFTYFIYRMPLTDSLVKIYGKPIGNSGFGKRVVLNYSAAL